MFRFICCTCTCGATFAASRGRGWNCKDKEREREGADLVRRVWFVGFVVVVSSKVWQLFASVRKCLLLILLLAVIQDEKTLIF